MKFGGISHEERYWKLDYRTLKPVLFEMPTYEYLRTGDIIGQCMKMREEN